MDHIRDANKIWAHENRRRGEPISSRREADLLGFRLQKYISVSKYEGEFNLKAIKENDVRALVGMQSLMALNIVEAAYVDLQQGLDDNVAIALALATHAQGAIPQVTSEDLFRWPLGKDWVDAYNAWNLAFVAQFHDIQFFPKLLIPSVLCSDGAGHETFAAARVPTLKLFMVYYANRQARGKSQYNVVAWPDRVRRAWGRAIMKYTSLQKPADCCDTGSLISMFERLYPPTGHEGWSFTNWMTDKQFQLFGTIVMWAAVVSAGLGAELILGPWLVQMLSSSDESSKTGEMVWHLAQCFFALNLSVAFFSRSALGLPFLVIGLWKAGFPETYVSLKQAYLLFRRAGHTTSDAVASFSDGMGSLVHHTCTAFIICGIITHIFPYDRVVIATCVVPIMQHMVVLLKYHAYVLFCMLSLFLEIWFEWEVIVNIHPRSVGVSNFRSGSLDFDRLARGCAWTMVISHWFYFGSAAISLVPRWSASCIHAGGRAKQVARQMSRSGRLSVARSHRNHHPAGQPVATATTLSRSSSSRDSQYDASLSPASPSFASSDFAKFRLANTSSIEFAESTGLPKRRGSTSEPAKNARSNDADDSDMHI